METEKTSTSRLANNSWRSRAGFTLIEILLVISLLGLLAFTVVPNITSVFRVGVQSSVRRYAALVKYAYDNAVLTGRIHRIVLDLDGQKWSVEAAEPGALPIDRERAPTYRDAPTDDPSFKIAGDHLVEEIPKGTHLVEVATYRLGHDKPPAKKGIISIYAFPGGFIDEATVVLSELGKENQQTFSVTTKSLTGRITVKTEDKNK